MMSSAPDCGMKRFPYRIFYQIKGDNVIVMRVLHHARDYTSQLY
jgi:plasmid stabilization system protein ParE